LHHFGFQIDRICRVLKLLGLVEEASSNLGFKPTHRLIDIIIDGLVQPITESETPIVKVGGTFVDSLWQLVAEDDEKEDEQEGENEIEDGERGGDGQAFCCQVFAVLGLLKERADGYVSTRLMHKLILENWVQQLSKTA
jgi:hypothetical protein